MKSMPVAATVLPVLSIVNVSVLVSLMKIWLGLKDLEKPGVGFARRLAVAVPLLPSDEVRSPEVLTKFPGDWQVTSTVTVQTVPAGALPPV